MKKFFPMLVERLEHTKSVSMPFSEVPPSYVEQPYNLAAKLRSRAGIPARAMVNQLNETLTIMRIN